MVSFTLFDSNLGCLDDPGIDQSTLYELGIDTTLVDLREEGSSFFCPMSEERWGMLGIQQDIKLFFNFPREFPSMADVYSILDRMENRLYGFEAEDGSAAYKATSWEAKECVGIPGNEDLHRYLTKLVQL